MTANELLLKRIIQDAIDMLRHQSREPLTTAAWAYWVMRAITALDDVHQNSAQTVLRTKPYTRAELRAAASQQIRSIS